MKKGLPKWQGLNLDKSGFIYSSTDHSVAVRFGGPNEVVYELSEPRGWIDVSKYFDNESLTDKADKGELARFGLIQPEEIVAVWFRDPKSKEVRRLTRGEALRRFIHSK